MNELPEPDVEVFQAIRYTYAEFGPVPEGDLPPRKRSRLGLPTLPFGWCGNRNEGAEHRGGVHKRSRDWRNPVVRRSPLLALFRVLGALRPGDRHEMKAARAQPLFSSRNRLACGRSWPRSTPPSWLARHQLAPASLVLPRLTVQPARAGVVDQMLRTVVTTCMPMSDLRRSRCAAPIGVGFATRRRRPCSRRGLAVVS